MTFTEEAAREGRVLDAFRLMGVDLSKRSPNEHGMITGLHLPACLGKDTNPSLSIDSNTGAWRDFGSSLKGDLVTMAKAHYRTDDVNHAIASLRDDLGMKAQHRGDGRQGAPPKPSAKRAAPAKAKAPIARTHIESCAHYLATGTDAAARAARTYLTEERGLTLETLSRHHIGLERHKGKWWITFPLVLDDLGARNLKRVCFDVQRGRWALNQKGKKIVSTHGPTTLYLFKEAEASQGPYLLTEGEIDALTARQHGYNALTGTGGALTFAKAWAKQMATLPSIDSGVIIAFDGDETGREGSAKVLNLLLDAGVTVRAVSLPDGEDVNSMLTAEGGAERFAQFIRQARVFKPKATGDPLAFDEAPVFDAEVLTELPLLFQETVLTFEATHERGVYLASAIPAVASLLRNVRGFYGHNSDETRPTLYAAIGAGAAGGKSSAKWARDLVEPVNLHIRTESGKAIEDWKQDQELAAESDESFDKPEPKRRSLVIPANASAAAFHNRLHANEGIALVFETEIDTLLTALASEWGKYDDTMRKGFHHEPVSYLRKTEEVYIECPQFSVVLTGTMRQLRGLLDSAENGLLSRFAVYLFTGASPWVDQRPRPIARGRADVFQKWADDLLSLYLTLEARSEPLLFELQYDHWDQINATFGNILRKLRSIGAGHLDSIVKRAGTIAFRIAMTLRVVRSLEMGEDLSSIRCVVATDDDMNAALRLAALYCDHTLRYARTLTKHDSSPVATRVSKLLSALPDEFSKKEAEETAEALGLGVASRTVRRDLEWAATCELITKLDKRGCYAKRTTCP